MAANVQLAGFPPIYRCRFYQGSDSRPGTFVADCMVVGPSDLTQFPRFANLTINARNFSGVWNSLRLTRAPKVRQGYLRIVAEDHRWLLKEGTISQNWNERDHLGSVMTGQEKTIAQLVAEIKNHCGLNLVTAATVPNFRPPAKWAGKTCQEAMADLLKNTGCRLVYNPVDQTWNVIQAGTGDQLDELTDARIFRPNPPSKIKEIVFRTAPILFESEMDVTAKEINRTTGETQALTSNTLPTNPNSDLGQVRYRLWEPDGVTHPEALNPSDILLLDHRVKTHIFDPEDPVREKARIIRDDFVRFPCHSPLYTPSGSTARLIELTGGGKAYLTDHPVLMVDPGESTLSDTCKLVAAYYVKEPLDPTGLRRETLTKTIDAGASDTITMDLPWIKPVDSTMPDIPATSWSALLSDVADAVSSKYGSAEAGTITIASPVNLMGSGRVGAVEYEFSALQYRPKIYFTVAIDFTPSRASATK